MVSNRGARLSQPTVGGRQTASITTSNLESAARIAVRSSSCRLLFPLNADRRSTVSWLPAR
jgi:hypothetical protein